MATKPAAIETAEVLPSQIERLDMEIITLLARRRETAQALPSPGRGRAIDPAFVEAMHEVTTHYREHLGGAGELVARAVMVLCHPRPEARCR